MALVGLREAEEHQKELDENHRMVSEHRHPGEKDQVHGDEARRHLVNGFFSGGRLQMAAPA